MEQSTIRRTAVYVDGFNLYHAIADLKQPHLKWVNLWALSESLLQPDERLIAVNYFSAFATWKPDQYSRHRRYIAALKHVGATVFMGKFKKTVKSCPKCNKYIRGHEEKESDVHASIRLVVDAIRDRFDVGILVSADSDLVPAVRTAQAESGKRIIVIAPPGRFDKARDLNPSTAITVGRLRQSLLPHTLYDADGKVVAVRPAEYDPPVAVATMAAAT